MSEVKASTGSKICLERREVMMPKATVIIPTYNRAALVKEAVDSVLQQSFSDFEVIVVDDGSTDGTREEVQKYRDPRIRYRYKENGGVSTARNTGLKMAKGQYILFLDSDDLWPDNYLEVMLEKLKEKPDYGAAYCGQIIRSPDGRIRIDCDPKRSKSGWITRALFLKNRLAPVHTPGTCFHRDVLEGFEFDPLLRSSQDIDAWLRLSLKTKFLFVPEVCFIRRKSKEHGISPRTSRTGLNANSTLLLERFYFRLGGDKIIPRRQAMRTISHAYRSVAKRHYKLNHRKASLYLYRKAIGYYSYDYHCYNGFLKALFIRRHKDKLPGWRMPGPLPDI
jgi:glycosyltransferase involved in cell wall biosynthesis